MATVMRDDEAVVYAAGKFVNPLCEFLGLDPGDVAELRLTPTEATAIVYDRNSRGSIFLGDDGFPAKRVRQFRIDTINR